MINFDGVYTESMSLKEFLETISHCSGDEAVNLIEQFQRGKLTIAGFSVEDVQ